MFPKSLLRLPETFLMNSKACVRRLQNSPSAQTIEVADLSLRQDSLQKRFKGRCKRGNLSGNRSLSYCNERPRRKQRGIIPILPQSIRSKRQ